MQPVVYFDAHEHHWEGAELLLGYARVANAVFSIGISAPQPSWKPIGTAARPFAP